MDQSACRRVDRERDGVRDRVVDVNEFDRHAAERDRFAGVDDVEFCLVEQAVLSELVFDQTKGQRCAENGQVHPGKQERQAADVILMTVGQDDTLHLVGILLDIGEVRDDQIDAEHVSVGECHAAVDKDHVAFAFYQGDILADLIESSQKGDSDRGFFDFFAGLFSRFRLRSGFGIGFVAALGVRSVI